MNPQTAKKIEKTLSNYKSFVYFYAILMNLIAWLGALVHLITLKHHLLLRIRKPLINTADCVADELMASGHVTTYRKNRLEVSDIDGFIETKKCDSLLFSSLYWAAGMNVNITMAQDKHTPGRWYRRSWRYPQCYPQFSGSTISRDMLIGLMVGAFFQSDFVILLDLHRYGRKRCWLMGEGMFTRIHFGSSLEALLAKCMLHPKFSKYYKKLSLYERARMRVSALKPITYSKGLSGYQAHLQTLVAILKIFAQGGYTDEDTKALLFEPDYNFSNLLATIVAASDPKYYDFNDISSLAISKVSPMGILNKVQGLLSHYPADRLPHSSDVSTHWVWEDSEPVCSDDDSDVTHSGGDILFLYKVCRNLVRLEDK
jgi:hypothetical protein